MSFGDWEPQAARSVAVDGTGNVWLTGYSLGSLDLGGQILTTAGDVDLFVAKLDPAGGQHWSRGFAAAFDQPATWFPTWAGWRVVATDPWDNIFVGGDLFGSMDFGTGDKASAGTDHAFVVKLAP